MSTPGFRHRRTILLWAVRVVLILPLTASVGGFAGWCFGAAVGEWLGSVGLSDVQQRGGVIGGVLGAVFGIGCVVRQVIRDDRSADPGGGKT
jgi:hypothetical protein